MRGEVPDEDELDEELLGHFMKYRPNVGFKRGTILLVCTPKGNRFIEKMIEEKERESKHKVSVVQRTDRD